jgi:protein-tyrosine phosphatase
MKGDIYWTEREFPGRIALISRPRGGDWLEDEVDAWTRADLDVIVSMLEDSEIHEFKLDREAASSADRGIQFVSYPVPDRGVPVLNEGFGDFVGDLRSLLAAGKNIGIHCRQGIGRAPLLAAAILVADGVGADEAFEQLSTARGHAVPETPEQAEWIRNFAHRFELVPS